jgi:hypothetical protein
MKRMRHLRDAVIIDLNKDSELIITTDGCTGVGTLKEDLINLDLRTVAWTACKVALMELLSLGARPIGYAFNHIASPYDYDQTVLGITQCMQDFGQAKVPFISSSEKNFPVSQTTITIALTGIREKKDRSVPNDAVYLLIGEPLVGQEVLEHSDRQITAEEFMQLLSTEGVSEIIPIGSHGVFSELAAMGIAVESCELDLNKSAGPATCVLAAVNRNSLDSVIKLFNGKCRVVSYGKKVEEQRNGVFHA